MKTLHKMFIDDYNAMTAEEKKNLGEPEEAFKTQARQVTSKWFRYFLTYNPTAHLKLVKCPVLAINVGKDLQVPPKENLAAIDKALREAGNENVTIKELPGLNHLFQKASTGNPSEYA